MSGSFTPVVSSGSQTWFLKRLVEGWTYMETKFVLSESVSNVPPTICLTWPEWRSIHGRKPVILDRYYVARSELVVDGVNGLRSKQENESFASIWKCCGCVFGGLMDPPSPILWRNIPSIAGQKWEKGNLNHHQSAVRASSYGSCQHSKSTAGSNEWWRTIDWLLGKDS